eukprot:SAG31_NODE_5034_length_2787_cov_5.411086_3_plen_143_part_00
MSAVAVARSPNRSRRHRSQYQRVSRAGASSIGGEAQYVCVMFSSQPSHKTVHSGSVAELHTLQPRAVQVLLNTWPKQVCQLQFAHLACWDEPARAHIHRHLGRAGTSAYPPPSGTSRHERISTAIHRRTTRAASGLVLATIS